MTSLLPSSAPQAGTTLPDPGPAGPGVYARRQLRAVRRSDLLALLGAAASSLALTCLLFFVVTPLSSPIGFVVVWWLSFVWLYAVIVSLEAPATVVADRVAALVVWSLGAVLFTALAFIIVYTFSRGLAALQHSNFLTTDLTDAGPLQGLDVGGILHAVVGTLEQISIALAITVPLGLTCAVFLNEFPGRFTRFVRTIVEAMTALPSVVAGLFIVATLIIGIRIDLPFSDEDWTLQIPKSGLAAALAISVMMLPIIIRAADVVIRLVPAQLREASYALGTSRWRTVWHVVLPTARSGLTTAVILGTARGIGETSPVLLTAGYTASMNANPLEGPQVSLPLAVFTLVRFPQQDMVTRAFGAGAALLMLVLILFIVARLVGGRGPGHDNARQRRRRAAASARDVRRIAARSAGAGLALVVVGLVCLRPGAPAYATDGYVPISGAGSTWSQNAIDQWRRNVAQYGMQINYSGTGSSDGRNQFRNGTVDFAVSEIPYGLTDGKVYDSPPDRGYAYMPIVAGGTSFMYNLKIGGKQVTNLRLSGDVLAKIFTGKITMWNDPAIAKDNPQLALPARQVVPVVRSDGSGTTAQFTAWLAKEHQSVWDPYCAKAGRPTPCGQTSFFPVVGGGSFVAQSGSLGVSAFVSQSQNEGSITYVEYSYALNTGFPVAKVLNHAGYYVEPTASNVAVGLLKAKIDMTPGPKYLTSILDGVYANPDRRAYPLSSYSYMIVPTKVEGRFDQDRGRTLGAFAYYFLCEGQQQADVLGYSPLPINLVQAGVSQVKRIPGVDVQSVDIKKCNNPTFSSDGTNTLAATAPYPEACDKSGPVQCTTGTGGKKGEDTQPSDPPGTTDSPAPATTPGTKGSSGTPTGAAPPGGTTGVPDSPAGSTPVTIDPETGAQVPVGTAADTGAGYVVTGQAMTLAAGDRAGMNTLLMVLGGLTLLLAVVLPPVVGQLLTRRGR
jgi:phosphate ABC transporter phosphate-binding protein/phosphate ABC transporter permease subunit PstA